MRLRSLSLLAASAATFSTFAQVNAPGRFQIGLGLDLGLFATHFENSYNIPFFGRFTHSDDDGAAAVSYPLDLQVGISNRWSIGLCLEPGAYVDSVTEHRNGFFIASLSPRFYLMNGDHFAWYLQADLGASALKYSDVPDGGQRYDDSYVGGHFRIGSGVQYYFGSIFGINAGLKFASYNLVWRDRDPEDPFLNNTDYEAKLLVRGVQFQLGVQVKL